MSRKRGSPRFQAMMRQLRKRREHLAMETEPCPTCTHALNQNQTTYCTNRRVKKRVGGTAVRCIGESCGVADIEDGK